MGWACGAYGEERGCIGSLWGNRREGAHWGMDGSPGGGMWVYGLDWAGPG